MKRSEVEHDDRPCVAVTPTPLIGTSSSSWSCEVTGATAPAPPLFLSLHSTEEELAQVRAALHCGVASVRRLPHRPRVLEKYTVAVLPGIWGRDLLILSQVIARQLGILLAVPLVLAGVMWALDFEFIAHAILVLFGALFATPVHELGHLIAFRTLAPPGALVRVWWSGMSAGLVRQPLSPARDIAVTLAGPLSPLLLVLILWPILGVGEVIAFAVVGTGHALSVFLPGGDRDTLQAARQYRKQRLRPPSSTEAAP